MGLVSKKTDEQIFEEGSALYKKGDLAEASIKLSKIARKDNPEACYLIAKVYLDMADKSAKKLYTATAKMHLQKAANAGHKEAIELMAQRFGILVPDVEVEEKQARREAMLEIVDSIEENLRFKPIKSNQFAEVEKFIRNHNLGISVSDVIAYRDTAIFSSGKKGHILTEKFLYYSDNGNRGTKVEFANSVSAESSKNFEFYVTYASGERKTFSHTEYTQFAEYYAKLINAFIALETECDGEVLNRKSVK